MTALCLIIFSTSTSTSAIAAGKTETVIPGYVSVQYLSQINLKSNGCQNINFEYLIDENLQLENTVWLVQIVHLTKNQIFGGTAWFSVLTYKGEDAIPSLPRVGKRVAKVCRKQWTQKSSEAKEIFLGIKPGKYRLYFAGVTLDPDTGSQLGEKTEVFKTIVFR
jgi:hypothetical protein